MDTDADAEVEAATAATLAAFADSSAKAADAVSKAEEKAAWHQAREAEVQAREAEEAQGLADRFRPSSLAGSHPAKGRVTVQQPAVEPWTLTPEP